jgi:dihydrofolate synthase/folylpolyglutamate synthase
LPDSLDGWLAYVEGLHPLAIDLGLDRVRAVAARLDLRFLQESSVKIVVGGTNGKGSTCALLDAILRAAGYRVGRYASPHLLRFNERALIDGAPAADTALLPHFAAVERARGTSTLTYFEFTTLMVLSWFSHERVDVAVLEVGLGGRLDAVNILDADCAIVTAIDLDHVDLLGPTREHIGAEKAPIYRAGRPAICADPDPPRSLLDHAERIGADLWRIGKDFGIELPAAAASPRQWNYVGRDAGEGAGLGDAGSRTNPRGRADPNGQAGLRVIRAALPWPALRGAHQLRNAAAALAAIEALKGRLHVDQQAVRRGLTTVQLAGRFQIVPGRPAIILDVAHNPHAARSLALALREHEALRETPAESSGAQGPGREIAHRPRTVAVMGMLRDKDAPAVVEALAGVIDHWFLVSTTGARGQSAETLQANAFAAIAPGDTTLRETVATALDAAVAAASPDDRIVVFGSFLVVADALRWLEPKAC